MKTRAAHSRELPTQAQNPRKRSVPNKKTMRGKPSLRKRLTRRKGEQKERNNAAALPTDCSSVPGASMGRGLGDRGLAIEVNDAQVGSSTCVAYQPPSKLVLVPQMGTAVLGATNGNSAAGAINGNSSTGAIN